MCFRGPSSCSSCPSWFPHLRCLCDLLFLQRLQRRHGRSGTTDNTEHADGRRIQKPNIRAICVIRGSNPHFPFVSFVVPPSLSRLPAPGHRLPPFSVSFRGPPFFFPAPDPQNEKRPRQPPRPFPNSTCFFNLVSAFPRLVPILQPQLIHLRSDLANVVSSDLAGDFARCSLEEPKLEQVVIREPQPGLAGRANR